KGSSDWNVIAPLWYRAERTEGDVHRTWSGIIPFWFSEPGGWIVPPALSWQRRKADGGTSTWITPLFHRDTNAAGVMTSMHLLTWFSGPEHDLVLPIFYSFGPPGATSMAVVPFWFSDPSGWTVPLALSWQRQRAGGGTSTWITPLFHRSTDNAGNYDRHIGPWLSGRGHERGYEAVLPLWYHRWDGPPGAEHSDTGLIPLWFSGPDFTVIPPALSARWTGDDGSTNTWITPLAHRSTRVDGTIAHQHVLNWFSGNSRDTTGSTDWSVVAPFWYHADRKDGDIHRTWSGVVPFWFSDPGGWIAPPALSWQRRLHDGGMSTWITPLFHRDTDATGAMSSMHLLNWLSGRDWQAVVPFAWRAQVEGGTNTGVIPLWFSGPRWWTVPLALSGGWQRDDGRRSDWFTPLVHVEHNAAGKVDAWHALNWLHEPTGDVVFPLAWNIGPEGARHSGVLPFWVGGPNYDVIPPLLSARWQRPDGGSTTWVTPLFHVGKDHDGQINDWHALNWIHDHDDDIVFPLAWFSGPANARYRNVIPFWFQGPNHLVVPPWYQVTHDDGTVSRGFVPLWFSSANWWVAPPVLSGAWTGDDGHRTVMATPFFHRTSDANGKLVHQHLLNWISSEDFDTVLPLYWRWRGDDGARRNLFVPLWYSSANRDGTGTTAVLPPLFAYRTTRSLDTSLPFQLMPFTMQSANDGHEINILWRLFHRRRIGTTTEYMVGPLWWSEHRSDAPTQWQILGGFVGRDTDQTSRTSRAYALWGLLSLGGRSPFPEVAP
ncbi:MAG: hypothetical protein AAB263_16875, partial [Planctomycetota bacterium]